jgi:uncharacterized protein (DUF305 family)
MQRFLKRRLGAVTLLAVLGLLAACGSHDSGAGSGTNAHNKADVAFVTNMIPHHAQGVQMAKMVAARGRSKELITLAGKIQDAQQSQIDTMAGWLKAWGDTAPATYMAGMGMGHSGMTMPGMTGLMTPHRMQRLSKTSSRTFDRLWLQMMVDHHQGAIDMANTELRDGQNFDAKDLAQQIVDSQQAQITTMDAMLHNHVK